MWILLLYRVFLLVYKQQKGFLGPVNDAKGRYINTGKYTYMHMWYKNEKTVGLHALANGFRLILEVLQLHVEGRRAVFML